MVAGPWGRLRAGRLGAGRLGATGGGSPRPPRLTREEARARNDRFVQLPRDQRRAILRAVNRGRAVDDRRHAPLAVAVAQRQQRFWRTAWVLGPTIALAQGALTDLPPEQVVLLAGWGTLVLGAMARWWWSRARRAELVNLTAAATRPGATGAGRRAHLPGGATRTGEAATDGRSGPGEGSAPRPPRPRGRKRRTAS